MPGISRVSTDLAGGILQGTGTLYAESTVVVVQGANVASHPPCPNPSTHCAATMTQSSATVFAGGVGVVRSGDRASCQHTASGSSTVFAG